MATEPAGEDVQGRLARLAGGCMEALLLRALVELDLPALVAARPADVGSLARSAGLDVTTLARILGAAEALGAVTRQVNGQYRLTPLGEGLRTGMPGSFAGRVLLWTSPWLMGSWQQLAESARDGRAPFRSAHGVDVWDFFTDHPGEEAILDSAMSETAPAWGVALADAVELPPTGVVVDVGGGSGELVYALVERRPGLRGVVADRPEMTGAVATRLRGRPSADRVTVAPTDFFESVPPDADVYVLARVLHNWDDAHALRLLRTCRAAMAPDSVLFVLEQLMPASGMDVEAHVTDLNMWVMYGGHERTEAALTGLLRQAGFTVDGVTRAGATCSVATARPGSTPGAGGRQAGVSRRP